MRFNPFVHLIAIAAVTAAGDGTAAQSSGLGLEVLVGGEPRVEYDARGATYIEALRGREYTLRVTNPLPVRVAVALAVDGLNTINASHGDARGAAKWVVEPCETIEISGWQVTGQEARAFFFTGERSSYGAWLGRTEDLGVIEAVFFREKPRPVHVSRQSRTDGAAKEREAPSASSRGEAAESAQLADEYAATGIGERRRHEVVEVRLDLEREPAASVRLRYEFRPQLEKLGVLPRPRHRSPLDRREDAHGFERDFCPDPGS